jgi:hypothetical protein
LPLTPSYSQIIVIRQKHGGRDARASLARAKIRERGRLARFVGLMQSCSHFFRITMVWLQFGITRRYGIHPLVYYQQCESMESAIANRPLNPSFPRRRESSIPRLFWIPACAGMTSILTASS